MGCVILTEETRRIGGNLAHCHFYHLSSGI